MISRPTLTDVLKVAAGEEDSARGLAVVATIVNAGGSTPLDVGAKAWIDERGLRAGTVGGGAAEAEALRRAAQAFVDRRSQIFDIPFQGGGCEDPRPVCGGSVRVLIHYLEASDRAAYREAGLALSRREPGILATHLPPPVKEAGPAPRSRWIAASRFDESADLAPDSLRRCLSRETLVLEREIFLEPIVPPPILLIVGAGHVGQALAAQAHLVGFAVTVLDDRAEFLDPAAFPAGTRLRCGVVPDEVAAFPSGPDTHIVLVTRGHQADADALARCIRRPLGYLGMIGSRRKVHLAREHFLANGWATAAEFDRVHAPIGLPIGAVTAPEIAASIIGQMIAVRRRGQAPRMPGHRQTP